MLFFSGCFVSCRKPLSFRVVHRSLCSLNNSHEKTNGTKLHNQKKTTTGKTHTTALFFWSCSLSRSAVLVASLLGLAFVSTSFRQKPPSTTFRAHSLTLVRAAYAQYVTRLAPSRASSRADLFITGGACLFPRGLRPCRAAATLETTFTAILGRLSPLRVATVL